MPMNFPDSPSNGDAYTAPSGENFIYNTAKGRWASQPNSLLTVPSSIIPDTDSAYDLGSATNKFRSLYLSSDTLYLGDSASISAGLGGEIILPSIKIGRGANAVRLEASASGKLKTKKVVGGVTQAAEEPGKATVVTDMAGLIAVTGMSAGQTALVSALNRVFMYTGTGWFKIADMTNATPTDITGVNGSYDLALDGIPTTITAISNDPEGFPLTWSHAVTSGSLGSTATITQADNVFTITPSTNSAHAGSFGITFSATDGATGAVNAASTFTLSFGSWEAPALLATFIPPTHLHSADFAQYSRRAKISSDGNTIVLSSSGVGGRADSSVGGQAYIYVTSDGGTTWTLQYTFSPTQSTTEQYYGVGDSLAISADGNTIAVSHSDYTDGSITYAGRVFVLSRTGTTWSTQQTLMRSGTNQQYGYYGMTIDLSDDGNTLAVGSNYGGRNNGGNRQNFVSAQAGEVSILTRSGTTWTEQTVFSGSDSASYDRFSYVCLSGDGNTLAVAAPAHDGAATNAGKIYIYKYNGSSWANSVGSNEEHTITTSNYAAGESHIANDYMGRVAGWNTQGAGGGVSNNALSLSYNGNTFAFGALANHYGGYVNVWTRSGSTWTHQQHFQSATWISNTAMFGTVTLDASGNKLLVGAMGEPMTYSGTAHNYVGAVYTYLRSGSTWTEHARIAPVADATKGYGGITSANFGHNVSMTGDGSKCLISADSIQYNDGVGVVGNAPWSAANMGRAYLYKEGV
jgi:hypothetical protein